MIDERLTRLEHDGLVFDVLDEGPLDGEVVVLLHGFPERAAAWSAVAARLHERGCRTLAPDQRGYSPGARPPRRRDHALQHLVGDVVALIERTGGPVHLVGHDWGAFVAWGTAALRPDLVRTLTAFSVPHPGAYLAALVSSSQLWHSTYVLPFQVPGLLEGIARRPGVRRILTDGGMTEADIEAFRRGMVAEGALTGGLQWYRAIPFASPGLTRRPVRVPTTMVWSDGDGYIVRAAIDRCARWVQAPYELVVLPGVTHWIPTQAPDAAADAIGRRIAG